MGDIVAHLENAILLEVNLAHARVLDLVYRFLLFDELLHTAQAHVHPRCRLLDGLIRELELTAARHLVRGRVYLLHHGADVFTNTLLAERLIVGHAKHIDRLIMLSANCVLAPLRQRVHPSTHLARQHLLLLTRRTVHIVAHNYFIATLLINVRKRIKILHSINPAID